MCNRQFRRGMCYNYTLYRIIIRKSDVILLVKLIPLMNKANLAYMRNSWSDL